MKLTDEIKMKIINPKDLKIINKLPPVAKKGDKVSIDSEFFGQTKEKLHRPHGVFAYLGCSFDGETVYYITDKDEIQEFYNRLDAAVHIYVNAKYDINQLRRFAKIPPRKLLYDAMLIEQIRFSGYYNTFGLADLARRYLDIYMTKEIRQEFSESDTLSKEQIEYACVDVAATWRVYKEQRAQIDENDLNIWKDIELPFLWVLLDTMGIKMDRKAWISLYEKNRGDAIAIQKKYMNNPEILDGMSLEDSKKKKKFDGVNLASWQQVSKHLHSRGIRVSSTQEDNLTPHKGDEFVDDLLEYRGKMKAAGTYGRNWEDDGYIESDDRVYSNFFQIGAATGRLSSSNPNVENIPVRETPEFRKCFIADKGNILIDADWSSQEPRIAAYLSQDEKLIEIFNSKKDVYIESARLMFGWELDKKDERRKTRMKPTVLGACYGLTEYGMKNKYDIPIDEGRELLETFFDTFEDMAEWRKSQRKRDKEYVTTIYGRKFWLNFYNRQWENHVLNSPVQGSAGDGIKLASVRFMEKVAEAGYLNRVWIVNYVHDEILIECNGELRDWTSQALRDSMIEVAHDMHEGILADVEISSGRTWHESHG